MNRAPSSQAIKERLRISICRQCPWAQPRDKTLGPETARSCEKTCPLFQQLPMLKQTAELVDPILRNRHVVLRDSIRRMAKEAWAKAGRCRGKRAQASSFAKRSEHIAKTIGNLFRW